jgi:hypothetical protein
MTKEEFLMTYKSKETDIAKDTEIQTPANKSRSPRKKVYERVRESGIPAPLQAHFKKDNYDLKLVRWSIGGSEDYRYLNRREREGYEFVQVSEIPAHLMGGLNVMDTKSHAGLVTTGDLCLMKVDCDLRNSRRKAYQEITDREVDSVDIHILEKKGFKNLGSKSKVMMREPTFQE